MKLKYRRTAHKKIFLHPGKLVFLLCLLTPAVFLPAGCASVGRREAVEPNRGNRETEQAAERPNEPGEEKTITGKISVKGSEPKTFVALTAEDGTVYEITGPLAERLAETYQYKTVVLEGKLLRKSAGPGIPAQFRSEKIVADG